MHPKLGGTGFGRGLASGQTRGRAIPRDLGLIQLTILERERRDPQRTGFLIAESLLSALRNSGQPIAEADLLRLQDLVGTTTVVLAPASAFRTAAALLQERGARVTEAGGSFRVLVIDADPTTFPCSGQSSGAP